MGSFGLTACGSVAIAVALASVCACGGKEPSGDPTKTGPGGSPSGAIGAHPQYPPGSAEPATDNGSPSGTYPAKHASAPQVVSLGGSTMAAPHLVVVTFASDAAAHAIDAFVDALVASKYLAGATREYGVGSVTVSAHVRVDEPPPNETTDAEVQTWLASHFGAGGWPAATESTVALVFYPAGTTITSDAGTSCLNFGGYHWEAPLGQPEALSYAVIPRCASFAGAHEFDAVTLSASHELVETMTNPRPSTIPAYAAIDDAHLIWSVYPNAEIADLCQVKDDGGVKTDALPYVVARSWSNQAAAQSHDPCVPAAGGAYFNSVPALEEDVDLGMVATLRSTKGVKIPVGESKTIDIELFSDGDTSGEWTVEAIDLAQLHGHLPGLALSLDRATGRNGERLHLTINAVRTADFGGGEFMITSTMGEKTSSWFGYVEN